MVFRHSNNLEFLKSACSFENPFFKTAEVIQWLKEQNDRTHVSVKKIPFSGLVNWAFDDDKGVLKHNSGKFFSIDGVRINTNWGDVASWEQPIINQPEIGYLGFIVKEFNGVLHFLMQAKIEPGNTNYVQLSPTLQATKSNYTRVHKGRTPDYLEYFQNAKPEQILVDQLQSEQGARFLRKRNRNIIIKTEDDIKLKENFIWLTLAQVKELMSVNNLINMDTRTVIAGIPYGEHFAEDNTIYSISDSSNNTNNIGTKLLESALSQAGAVHTFEHIINFITKQKCFFEIDVRQVPVKKLKHWNISGTEIYHDENKYFKIIATEVEIGNREVLHWTQPMVQPAQEGICAFVCKELNGVLHFIVQSKLECGNFDIIEFAPTVQCLTGNYRNTFSASTLPFLDYVMKAPPDKIIFDTMQSEEGGRFFLEQNRNMLVMAGNEIQDELPDNYIWMTLNQLQTFIKFNNYVNIQARSLIAAMAFTTELKP